MINKIGFTLLAPVIAGAAQSTQTALSSLVKEYGSKLLGISQKVDPKMFSQIDQTKALITGVVLWNLFLTMKLSRTTSQTVITNHYHVENMTVHNSTGQKA